MVALGTIEMTNVLTTPRPKVRNYGYPKTCPCCGTAGAIKSWSWLRNKQSRYELHEGLGFCTDEEVLVARLAGGLKPWQLEVVNADIRRRLDGLPFERKYEDDVEVMK